MFSEQEQAFLQEQLLARIATGAPDGQPSVDVVRFEFDGAHFYIGGSQASRKYKNVVAGNKKVSLLLDDLKSVQPWEPRGIRIDGMAEAVEHQGHFGPGMYLMITPKVSWSWGIEAPALREGKPSPKKKMIWE